MKPGKALREYMKRQGIKTQHQLALDLQLTDGMISHYFKGIRQFAPKTAFRISKQTGIPFQELYQ